MPRRKSFSSPYASIIATATGAPQADLPLLETIMREHVFHSTLDWQSETELCAGAIQAKEILRRNRTLFDLRAAAAAEAIRIMEQTPSA